MPIAPNLAKKTKQDIVEEYNKLMEKYDEIKMTASAINKPENLTVINKAKEQTASEISQSIFDLKKSVNSNLNELSNKLSDNLSELLNKILSEADKFNELQQAIELSKKNLENNYHIQIAAETLADLVADYENKKKQFAEELKTKQENLELEISQIKRAWEREQEEYDYDIKLKQSREQEVYNEKKIKQEKELAEQTNRLNQQNEELLNLRAQTAAFPDKLTAELSNKEKMVEKVLTERFEEKLRLAQKDWLAEKNLDSLKLQNLQEQIKKQEIEIAALKKEAELSNRKAQELAVKVIESGASKRNEIITDNKDAQRS